MICLTERASEISWLLKNKSICLECLLSIYGHGTRISSAHETGSLKQAL